MKTITQEEFDEFIRKSVSDEYKTKYVIIEDYYFDGIVFPDKVYNIRFVKCFFDSKDVRYVEFQDVHFRHCEVLYNFFDCTFNYSDFEYCYLKSRRFYWCAFDRTIFSYSDLESSNFNECKFIGVAFRCSSLIYSNFTDVVTTDVEFTSCRLTATTATNTGIILPQNVPSHGSFIGWKKAYAYDLSDDTLKDIIVKLYIPEDAIRYAPNHKCRANKVEVLGFETLHGEKLPDDLKVFSMFDPEFMYKIGTVTPKRDFYANPQEECSPGIHFFLNRNDAVAYKL